MTLCDFKKHLSYRIRTDQPVLSYLNYIHFEGQETIGENDISCILLTFSCLVPMLSVLKIYNKQRSNVFDSPYSGQCTLF